MKVAGFGHHDLSMHDGALHLHGREEYFLCPGDITSQNGGVVACIE
jgi:hypothetical protein